MDGQPANPASLASILATKAVGDRVSVHYDREGAIGNA
jgi:hypothetical protein